MDCTQSIVYGCGYVNRIKLKHSKDYIHGYISIRTHTNNIVSFNAFSKELTSNDKPNPSFKCLKKVMEEYKDYTTDKPDFVEIPYNEKFPCAAIDIRNNGFQKQLKMIHRVEPRDIKIMFKMFGLKVGGISNDEIKCTSVDYNQNAHEIIFKKNKDFDVEIGDIIDVKGTFIEGLYDGKPIDELFIVRIRKSNLDIDFENARKVEEIDPF